MDKIRQEMEGHIDKKDAALYAYGLLPKSRQDEIDLHITSCSQCMDLITLLQHKRIDACKRMHSLFEDAYKDRLTGADARFWNSHLKYCDSCFDEYKAFLRKKERGLYRLFIGYLSGIADRMVELTHPQVVPVLSAKKEMGKANLDITNIKRLSKKGMDITFIQDKKGNLKAYLSSSKYDVSGVNISLTHRTKDGYVEVAKAVTGKRGIANFGNIKGIASKEGKRGYAVIISDFTAK